MCDHPDVREWHVEVSRPLRQGLNMVVTGLLVVFADDGRLQGGEGEAGEDAVQAVKREVGGVEVCRVGRKTPYRFFLGGDDCARRATQRECDCQGTRWSSLRDDDGDCGANVLKIVRYGKSGMVGPWLGLPGWVT